MSSIAFSNSLPECDIQLEHTLLPVTRYEYKNLFHQMTDFLNAFMVAVLAGEDLSNTQVRVASCALYPVSFDVCCFLTKTTLFTHAHLHSTDCAAGQPPDRPIQGYVGGHRALTSISASGRSAK